MTAEQAAHFDMEMQAPLLSPFALDGLLNLSMVGGMIWGKAKRVTTTESGEQA
jgi:hypothetical protein